MGRRPLGLNPDRVNPMNDKSTMNKILEYMALEKPIVQFEVAENLLAGPPRPKTRTTDDYLRERAEIEAARAKVKAERAKDDGDA